MHLLDILSSRPVPAAGLIISLTRHSPLSGGSATVSATSSDEDLPRQDILTFVERFSPDDRPELVLLSGEEPLLRPRLVLEIAERAHRVGSRVCLVSGMSFARQPEIPAQIARAIAAVDHFTASLDFYHAQPVPRAAAFRVVQRLLDAGQDVSFQVTGLSESDPFLPEVTGHIRSYFDDRVPVLVGQIGASGRARDWMDSTQREARLHTGLLPCTWAAWPIVGFNGTVTACGNQRVVEGPVPRHLWFGHVAVDDWRTVRERCVDSAIVRALRLVGPLHVSQRCGCAGSYGRGYCGTCIHLADSPYAARHLEPSIAHSTWPSIEQQAAVFRPEQLLQAYGMPAYAGLARLGHQSRTCERCAG